MDIVLNFLLQIVIVLVAIKIFGEISIRLGQPSVLGKIVAGILLGPAVLGWVQESDIMTIFSQIGVLLLMFMAGLETDLEDLARNAKSALLIAVGGVVMPIILGYLGGALFNFTVPQAIFMGLLLAATSVSISVQTLRELGWLNSREGSALLGAAVLDDVIVVILIAVAMSLFTGSGTSIGQLVLYNLIFFVGVFVLSKWVVPGFIQFFAKFEVTEITLSAALIIAFAFAYAGEMLGVAGIIGTFAAGVAISETKFKEEVIQRVEPVANGIFVPFFFISIGLPVTFEGIGDQVGFLVYLTILALISKLAGCGLGAKMSGFGWRSSIGIGAGMISRGEVALILAAIGLESGLLAAEYYTSAIIVVILTTVVTPPLLKIIFGKRDANAAEAAQS